MSPDAKQRQAIPVLRDVDVTTRLEVERAEWESTFGEQSVPQWVKDSLARYVEHGIPTGDFMRAVLANDLLGAFSRADVATARSMAAIVCYVARTLPPGIFGSYAVVDTYAQRRRAELAKAED